MNIPDLDLGFLLTEIQQVIKGNRYR